jgi:hypothetical protein
MMNGFVLIASKVGTPIFSKQYKPNFGLRLPSSSNDNNNVTLSDTSLSGLLFALKLNAELSSQKQLSQFSFNDLSIHFYEHPDIHIMSAVFMNSSITNDNSIADTTTTTTTVTPNHTTPDSNEEWCIGDYYARELCHRFAEQYPKVVSNLDRSARRRFDSFQPTLNSMWKDGCKQYLDHCIKQISAQTGDEMMWMFVAYSHDYFSKLDCEQSIHDMLELLDTTTTTTDQPVNIRKRAPSAIIPVSTFEFDTPVERESVSSGPLIERNSGAWMKRVITYLNMKNRRKKEIIHYLDDIIGQLQLLYVNPSLENNSTDNVEQILNLVDNALTMFHNAGQIMGFRSDHVEQFECQLSAPNQSSYLKLICLRYNNLFLCAPWKASSIQQTTSQELLFILHDRIKEIALFLDSISNIADVSFRENVS